MKSLLFFIIVLFPVCAFAQQSSGSAEAFRISAETRKPILLVFSGSDWCAPCMMFDKKILSEPSFQSFAKDHLVILKADFPQRKKLPKEIKEENDALAERYNPKGLFPHLVLLAPDQTRIITLIYGHQTIDEFISEITSQLSHE